MCVCVLLVYLFVCEFLPNYPARFCLHPSQPACPLLTQTHTLTPTHTHARARAHTHTHTRARQQRMNPFFLKKNEISVTKRDKDLHQSRCSFQNMLHLNTAEGV